VPDGPWRPHVLERCPVDEPPPAPAARALAECWSLYRAHEGSDAIMELELSLRRHGREGLVLLTLGQLYLMAGQGEPSLLPDEGPAADVGNWAQNRVRLLRRAETLLTEAAVLRPDDAAVDFLLADVARARLDTTAAAAALLSGQAKCTLPASFHILQEYQGLNEHPARLLRSVAPDYPEQALQEGITGEVELDLLISPAGKVEQVVAVRDPDRRLTAAAAAALRQTLFEPARVGKYPIWSWLRVPTRFQVTPRE
jgi:TonB family protein